LNEAIVHTMQA